MWHLEAKGVKNGGLPRRIELASHRLRPPMLHIKSNAQFFTAVQPQQSSNTVIGPFVGLSVAFGTASVLVVSVIQRSTDMSCSRFRGHSA